MIWKNFIQGLAKLVAICYTLARFSYIALLIPSGIEKGKLSVRIGHKTIGPWGVPKVASCQKSEKIVPILLEE